MGDRSADWPLAERVELIQDVSPISAPLEGYLRRHRHRIKTVFDDGSRSETYVADYVDRDPNRRDAVTVAVYARLPGRPVGETQILLRRQLRYAAYVVNGRALTTELIAGLIEDGEPPLSTAVRELWEEAGLEVDPSRIEPLGRPYFMLPGIFTERIVPLVAEVGAGELRAAMAAPPPGDGSPFEEGSELVLLSLAEALSRIEQPEGAAALDDAKTEIGLVRLWRRLESGGR